MNKYTRLCGGCGCPLWSAQSRSGGLCHDCGVTTYEAEATDLEGVLEALLQYKDSAVYACGTLKHILADTFIRIETVPIKSSGWRPNGECWLALYKGKWRVVHEQSRRSYIVCKGQKIDILIYESLPVGAP